jgi:acetyl esterase/lipase
VRFSRYLTGAFILLLAQQACAQGQFLRSKDSLGDPRGYCLDIPGFGPGLGIGGPLSSHSCKYGIPGFWVDELFELTDDNRLRFPEFDVCLSAEALAAGARPTTVECASQETLAWNLRSEGRISPAQAPSLCITFSGERTFVNTTENTLPAYSSRDVTLEPCRADLVHLQLIRWADPMEQSTYRADTLQAGMPAEIRNRLAEIGTAIDPRATQQIYADEPRMFSLADVTRTDPIRYGRNANHVLQVYVGRNRSHPRTARVLMLVHGGGFTGGGLESLTTVATHFAGLGYVVINMTYPLAPEHRFPAGAQAVAEALEWTRDNIADYDGNPDQIFVLGHSAGGNHVANFALRPGVLNGEVPRAAGVILASPAVNLDPDQVGDPERAYFGDDMREWPSMSLLENIEDSSTPVLILLAENDPAHMWQGASRLFSELVNEHSANPRLRQMLSHGHISYITSIGTADRMAVEEILDFISPTGF